MSGPNLSERRASLEEILASPELDPAPDSDLFERLVRWLRLDELNLDLPAGSESIARILCVALLGAALLFVVWRVVRLVRARLAARRAPVETVAVDEAGPPLRGPEDALERARRAEEAGRLRTALHWLHLGALLILERARLLSLGRGRTNRELLAELPGDAAERFRPLVTEFDAIWYGGRPCDAATLDRYRDGLRGLPRSASSRDGRERGRVRAELVVVIGVFALLVLAMAFGFRTVKGRMERGVAGATTHSTGPEGLRALQRWAEQGFGRETLRVEDATYGIPEETSLLFLVAPLEIPDEDALTELRHFVEDGGVLVLAGGSDIVGTAERFDVELDLDIGEVPTAASSSDDERESTVVSVDAVAAILEPEGSEPLLLAGDDVIATTRSIGRGRIVVVGAVRPFTNQGLDDPGASAFVDGLISAAPPGAVAFDEFHHGYRDVRGVSSLLVRTNWGAALIYAIAVVFLYLALGGRRFARPLPIGRRRARPATDFILAMAETHRRAGRSGELFRDLAAGWRRRTSRSLGLRPDVAAPAFVAAAARTYGVSEQRIERLLIRLADADLAGSGARRDLVREMDAISGPRGNGRRARAPSTTTDRETT